MEQFTVPQFIDVEDKIVGPLSVRQFLILLAAGGLCFAWYKIFTFTVFVILSILTVILAGSFAFVKVGGVTLHYFLLNVAQVLRFPGVRVWAPWYAGKDIIEPEVEIIKSDKVVPRSFTSSHLNQLALIVDTRGYYGGDSEETDIFSVLPKDKNGF